MGNFYHKKDYYYVLIGLIFLILFESVLAVFLWDRVNRAGGLSSMISGVIITLVWEILLKKPYDINSVVVAVPVAVIILIVVTLITTKPKAQETTKTEAKEA